MTINIFNKKDKSEETSTKITTGQISIKSFDQKNIFVDNYKTVNLLKKLIATQNKIDCIDIIINEIPDGKMAYNTYLRIANQGFKVELYNVKTGKTVKKYDKELRDFMESIGNNNSAGMDGIIDQLHGSSVARGGMAVEVVVNSDATAIDEVVIIDPKSISEFKWLEDKKRYAIYQDQSGWGKEKVDLCEGNFLWIPHQPKAGSPEGTLQFEPAIVTMTQYYQLIQDSMAVLNRIGFPKYKATVDLEKLVASASASEKSSQEKMNKLINETISTVESQMRNVDVNSNIITTSTTDVDIIGGGVNGSGIDIRAWFEVLEPLITNSFQLTPVLLGRLKSGSYSLGTVEYKIVVDTIETMRRNSKRIIEQIVNYWCIVNGINCKAKVTHNPIDWEQEKVKLETELLKIEKARRSQEYKWVNSDTAAQMAIGAEKSYMQDESNFEYIKKSINGLSDTNTNTTGIESEE